jgi:hypothetical protein
VEKIMKNATTTTSVLGSVSLTVLDSTHFGSRGTGVELTHLADALIDAAGRDTMQRKEFLTNDVPPGTGG